MYGEIETAVRSLDDKVRIRMSLDSSEEKRTEAPPDIPPLLRLHSNW